MGVKEIKIGLLTLVGIAVGYLGFNYLKGNSVFHNGTILYSIYSNVEGLHVGSKVVINGFTVGKVKRIYLINEAGDALVAEYIIDNSNLKIPKNSLGEVVSTDLFGSKAISILIGDGKEVVVSGDTLASKNATGMFDMVEEKITPYQEKVDQILLNLDSLLGGLKQAVGQVNYLMASQTGKVDQLTTKNFDDNNAHVSATLANLHSISDSLDAANVKEVISNANKAMTEMAAAMEKINKGNGTLGKLVNDSTLYKNLTASTEALEILLKDVEAHPKKYVHFSVFGKKSKEEKESSTNKKNATND